MAIAANLVVFGVTNAAILRPLDVAHADQPEGPAVAFRTSASARQRSRAGGTTEKATGFSPWNTSPQYEGLSAPAEAAERS